MANNIPKPNSTAHRTTRWIARLFPKQNQKRREDQVTFEGVFHARNDQILLFPHPNCRIDHEVIKVNKLNARIYRNFLVVDGQLLIKCYFLAYDDLLRMETMATTFLTTLELWGLESGMRIEFGEIQSDYCFSLLAKELEQTSYHNEIVLEIPYTVYRRQTT